MAMRSKYEWSSRQPSILSRKRKAENEIEISSPSPEHSSPPSSSLMQSSCGETPTTDTDAEENQSPRHPVMPNTFSQFRGLAVMMDTMSYTCRRASPLPEITWAQQKDLWHSMVVKDMVYPRDPKVLLKHPELEPRMRAILLDWLTEVCEVYRLHRETFYLAQDYVDRFLMTKTNLPRNCLQLLGATALFVASKMEEIYPPKLEQFAFVTDGACTESEILTQELVLLRSLNWNLTPVTVNGWLNMFMQVAYLEDGENLIGPEKYPRNLFTQISQVTDLCILDIENFKYRYSVIAASGVAHFISKKTAIHVSGIPWEDMLPCVTWMKQFVETAVDNGGADMKHFSDISTDDWHNIQSHSAGLKLLDQVHEKQRLAAQKDSPSSVIRQLTPPLSDKKMNHININTN